MDEKWTDESNTSNCIGWDAAAQMDSQRRLDIPRNTCQAMVLIIFKTCENSFGALHNRMVVNRPIFKAYGNGEYLGMSKCLRRMEGWFPENTGVATICFESEDLALKCLDSKTPMREPNWMSGPEIYVIPLCNSMWRFNDRPYLQIDMYDVKHGVNFVLYLNLIEEMVRNHGGVMIAGTREMFRFRGVRMPMFILIYQWEHLTQAECYNREVEQILRESGSSCSTRVLFEMDAHCSRY